ncbi:hypothetical protein Tco_0685888, partial [Tanacetum coccineum]
SSNEGWKRWDDFDNTNRDNKESENEMEHEDEERCDVFDDHERPVCYIRRFEMVKYSFRDDKRPRCKEIDEVGEVSIIWNPMCDCSHAGI